MSTLQAAKADRAATGFSAAHPHIAAHPKIADRRDAVARLAEPARGGAPDPGLAHPLGANPFNADPFTADPGAALQTLAFQSNVLSHIDFANHSFGAALAQPGFAPGWTVRPQREAPAPARRPGYRRAKRAFDLLGASVGLVLLAPLLLGCAAAIKLGSPGPVFFRQNRYGRDGRLFSIYKFRTMRSDLGDGTGVQQTVKNDPRVTRVGAFLRRSSFDELPQLLNVLDGTMSLVGPRPHATMMRVGDKYYFDAVKGYTARHRVKPGITGLAQVRGLRGEIATTERARKRVEYDIYYIENWSPLLDIRIMIETVLKLVWDKNAY